MQTVTVGTAVRGAAVAFVALGLCACGANGQADERMETAADVERAMRELSNQGRWGADDEIGAANFITPDKRRRAAALVQEGLSVSLAHDIVEEEAVDATTILNREVLRVSETGGSDRLQYTGSYHGYVHSHLDSLDCHVMKDGVGHTGATLAAIEEAGGCPSGSIHALRNGIVTRAVLFDATLLPGKATAEGWLEPGTPVRKADLEALEEIQGVRAEEGDVILLHTGRWQRRAALGPWGRDGAGVAGYHADVAYFLKERGIAFIGHDMSTDVAPTGIEGHDRFPLHELALVSLGVGIFDNLDFAEAAEVARQLGRYEFLFTAAPLRIRNGMGSPINPIATF